MAKVNPTTFLWYIFSFIFLLITYFFLYKLLMPRILAFGCFDDCFNFIGGYFLSKGKTLYSEIFFNHQPLAAYLSFFIQTIKDPQNIYELVLVHRQFLLLFSFIMNFLLLIRFRWAAIGFILFYEFTKFYIFGDRFLAESFIAYPLVYLSGLVFYKFQNLPLNKYDYILSAMFVWFVLFMREPYTILSLFLFAVIFIGKPFSVTKKISVGLLFLLTMLTLSQFSLKDYFFNVVTVNNQAVLGLELRENLLNPSHMMKIIFYPFFILLEGKWNIFRQVLIGIDIVFLSLMGIYLYRIKRKSKVLIPAIIIILALANLRATTPGAIFYEAFHMVQWYSIFLFFVFLLTTWFYKIDKKISLISYGILIGIFGYFMLSGKSYIAGAPNPHFDLITYYGKELSVGETVRKLSFESDTLFLDGFDDLIYWQAKRISPYKYSWYTSSMHTIPLYSSKKNTMFLTNPPDFYYGSCHKSISYWDMPQLSRNQYVRLYTYGKLSCLFVHKQKLPEITLTQWKQAEEFGYTLQ